METILSGIQPTGKLHLGNYIGAIKNWVELQEKYRCYYMIADLHSLTVYYTNTEELQENILELYIDLLSAGLSDEKSVIFLQSGVPAHSQLHLLLSMITPLGWLERNPTYKEKIKELKQYELNTYGFLGYPVLQAADILIYKAQKVPVGQDQIPHLEITREIARRFNYLYGEYFPEPQPILTPVPKIAGTDGKKMSKSYNNAIYMSDPPEVIEKKIRMYITDTKKIYKNDPGNPENCTLFPFYKIFADKEIQKEIISGCASGKLGCVACKKRASKLIIDALQPFREKREELKKNKKQVWERLKAGTEKAKKVANTHLEEILEKMKLNFMR